MSYLDSIDPSKSVDVEVEKETLLPASLETRRENDRSARTRVWMKLLCACFMLVIWATSCFVAVHLGRANANQCVQYRTGFPTDFKPAIEAVELQTVKFTGDFLISPNGTYHREQKGTQYVGTPTAEMDEAWRQIFRGTGVDLTEDEARLAGVLGKTYQKPSGYYLAGMSVFHEIHCLNKIRRATYPEYYPPYDGEDPVHWRSHLDHCIDAIRQSLMCSSDMSVIKVEWNEATGRIVPDLDAVHTCRNFEKLQQWALDRNAERHEIGSPSDDKRKEKWFIEAPEGTHKTTYDRVIEP